MTYPLPLRHSVLLLVMAVAATQPTVSSNVISLKGAGASFPAEVYKSWLPSFRQHRSRFVHLQMSYDSVGSGTGKSWIKEPEIHGLAYAGSDSLIAEKDYELYPDLQMFPVIAGAIVIGFNMPGISTLNLSRHHIVGIYNGTYQWWNNTDIQKLNPYITLPGRKIIPIARADKSGSTEIFTNALSSFSPEWADQYGAFGKGLDGNDSPIYWDGRHVDMYGMGDHGATGLLLSTKYSIAYVSVAAAKSSRIKIAHLQNQAGQVVGPSTESVQAAMDDMKDNFTEYFTVDLVDAHGQDSYPIAGYTYFIIHKTNMTDCESARELYRYVLWAFYDEDARRETVNLNFVPLSPNIAKKITEDVLSGFICKGVLVSKLHAHQLHKEEAAMQTSQTHVYVGASVSVVVILGLVALLTWHQVKLNMPIIRNEWKITVDSITMNMLTKGSGESLNTPSVASTTWGNINISVGRYKDDIVLLRNLNTSKGHAFRRASKKCMIHWRDSINHLNVSKFHGMAEHFGCLSVVSELCSKGMLMDILQNDSYNLDINFMYSICQDVAEGMRYLHNKGIVHGNLTTSSCLIDSRWTVKISDWQYTKLAQLEKEKRMGALPEMIDASGGEAAIARSLLCLAPECLENKPATKESDSYSFSIAIVEVFTRGETYGETLDTTQPSELIKEILEADLRPPIPRDMAQPLRRALHKGWDRDPAIRPSLANFVMTLDISRPSRKSVLDCMMESVDEYMERIQEKTAELDIAMNKMKHLLHQMLPPSVADKLASGQHVHPEAFESVTVFFSDIVGFTSLSSESTPFEIVHMLNDLYMSFDSVIDNHKVYKVETIGDAYMVVSGCPERNGSDHAGHIASMAIDFAFAAMDFKIHHRPHRTLQLRAGIHSGPACAGVVGHKMPRYCLFGDTVNTASRMESTSVAMKIQITDDTHNLLAVAGGFDMTERGSIYVKGKGYMRTYWLQGKENMARPMPPMFCRQVDE